MRKEKKKKKDLIYIHFRESNKRTCCKNQVITSFSEKKELTKKREKYLYSLFM